MKNEDYIKELETFLKKLGIDKDRKKAIMIRIEELLNDFEYNLKIQTYREALEELNKLKN